MDYLNYIENSKFLMVFISTILGMLSSYIVQRYMSSFSYRNDYFKKVVDKRIQAYEKLEECIHCLDASRDIKGKEGKIQNVLEIFLDQGVEKEFSNKYDLVVKNITWYSENIRKNIIEMEGVLWKVRYLLRKKRSLLVKELDYEKMVESIDASYAEQYQVLTSKLNECCKEIRKIMKEDWRNLYKVDNFFKK